MLLVSLIPRRDSEVVLDFALVDSVTSDPTAGRRGCVDLSRFAQVLCYPWISRVYILPLIKAAEDFLIKFFDSDDGMEGEGPSAETGLEREKRGKL